ncbi:hypothetical protein [Brachyspira hyodysenteriae]|uniref:hypothetical protein n=1 Tax=Brachyspira hyodysenteriae TaxID=159 RepID=UPI001ADDE489|nr:hypothetical protein [Brachyspira hyodysenteriae]
MIVKELKEELEKFEDDTQIFVRVKDEDGEIILSDFGRINKKETENIGVIVPLFKVNKE